MPSTISAAILAGGRATRLGGQDKSRLVVDGRSIIVRQVDVLQRVADDVFVVAPDAGRFADLGLPVHADEVVGAGAIGGLLTALDTAAGTRVLVVACDLPFLHPGLLSDLVRRAEGADGAWVRSARGVEPLLACYQKSARAAVRAAIGAGRLRMGGLNAVLAMNVLDAAEIARHGSVDTLLANVNTPADYARVQYRPR
jgi:molybdopterin-guanine dinucleotide biosynthesis protein A